MIVINARFLTHKTTGVERYAIEMCKRISKNIGNHKVIFVAPKGKLNKIDGLNNIIIKQFGFFKGPIWEQIDLFLFLKRNKSPLLLNFSGIGPAIYENKIVYLHDLAFKHHPENFSFLFQKIYNVLIPISIRKSKKIITVSKFVKQDIITNYGLTNIEVIYGSQSGKFKNLSLKREKIILAVSSLDPRKNFNRIIKAYQKLETDYKLVFVGSNSKAFSKIIIDNNYNDKNIIFTGYLTDKDLVKMYNKASIFIYASLFEGFGIPPLEAQSCGCPCIVSNLTSIPEICNNSVMYCNPFSVKDIADKIEDLIIDKKKREELVKKGFENIKKYSWDASANKLLAVIKKEIM
ncbi:glycosyltransferase family 1 protein [uncultured Polaribacter sp.]|uniref:glycosyltransferase family 4 protein n=1 Tax=uncultured Polaribacter sp. TaxID=174711 RepID=UPI00261DA5AA|nr:glycosyltransferase family 1 protein [uncultured Polaribacter sp.]